MYDLSFLKIFFRELLAPIIDECIRKAISEYIPHTNSPPNQILDIHQAADLLGLAVPTIYSLTSKNMLSFYKRGKKLYFKKDELLEWIESGKRNSKSEIEKIVDNQLQNRRIK